MISLTLQPNLTLTDETFEQLCHINPDLRLERTAQGDLIAMVPAGSESGYYNANLSGQLWYWNNQTQTGYTFDSSSGFTLPNGAIRSPDAAWIEKSRWDAIPIGQRRKFAPLCPDFVIELQSPTDELSPLQAKLQEYLDNGTRLGWLIAPDRQTVYCYQPDRGVQILQRPPSLSGADVLPGFTLDLQFLWT
ncbi:Uma2 family endonuclease [Prochlorothrix hollandica]|uniref:Putative restriction endonuclease domain-containing protein n=1 Tax=Prochlorothrix hollandica PCC 9006 = CALU 1027 TaxID=317619 RepID=A0A0M2PWV3_PROHO|nr:Uma2 family endonuclease [Prochlorothrix hollandica]KKI99572.1 hypothetical protein PROH_06490 [Prochlorothrix hollandica PCC 9006 = CALU 1027]